MPHRLLHEVCGEVRKVPHEKRISVLLRERHELVCFGVQVVLVAVEQPRALWCDGNEQWGCHVVRKNVH